MKPEASRALITQITIRDVDASVIQRSDNVDGGISVIPLAVRFATARADQLAEHGVGNRFHPRAIFRRG